jgi:hypothetical protein
MSAYRFSPGRRRRRVKGATMTKVIARRVERLYRLLRLTPIGIGE